MQSFVITLVDNTTSMMFSQKTVESSRKYGIDCKRWPAIHGSAISKDTLQKVYQIENVLKKSMLKHAGVLGCFLSHFSLWQYCIKINEAIIILEHDAKFIRTIPDNILDHFDDVLKLDAHHILDIDYHNLVKMPTTKEPKYVEIIADGFSKAGNYSLGAHAYIIKPSGAEKLIQFSQKFGILPTDLHIGSNIVNFKQTTISFVCLQETHTYNNIKELSSTTDLITFGKK